MTSNFSGQVALVAGGTGALGQAISLAFLHEGARVIATYRRQDELDALRRQAGGDAERLDGQRVDVGDEAAVQALVQGQVEGRGHLDILVNAVGGYAGGARVWEGESSVLERMLAVNVRAAYLLSRAAVPPMLARGRGAIVNVASRAAWVHGAGEAAYAASKAAALALFDALAAETKGTGVRVNSILPGTIDTPANRRAMPGADVSAWTKPEEIARVVLFLCSDEARAVHGAAIPVFGDR